MGFVVNVEIYCALIVCIVYMSAGKLWTVMKEVVGNLSGKTAVCTAVQGTVVSRAASAWLCVFAGGVVPQV